MAWSVSRGSAGQQHWELIELARAVIGPLKSGLCSFNTVSEMLLSIDADIVLPGCQTFDDIRRQIKKMKQRMEESEQIARVELQRVDRVTESLTAEQSVLARQKSQKKGELQNLNTQLNSHQSSLRSYSDALETERSNLRSAEDTLNNMRAKRDEAESIRNAGIGVMFIPIVGWIAGGIMVGVGQSDMDQASDAVDRANQEVQSCESQVNSYSSKVNQYKSLIYQVELDIRKADNKIHETDAKLQNMSVKRRVVADIQDKMRRAVHQLGLVCGVGSAAELQTRRLILLEPVMKLLEEMTTVLGQGTGNELLHTEGIQSLMCDMKKNHKKLKERASANKSIKDAYI